MHRKEVEGMFWKRSPQEVWEWVPKPPNSVLLETDLISLVTTACLHRLLDIQAHTALPSFWSPLQSQSWGVIKAKIPRHSNPSWMVSEAWKDPGWRWPWQITKHRILGWAQSPRPVSLSSKRGEVMYVSIPVIKSMCTNLGVGCIPGGSGMGLVWRTGCSVCLCNSTKRPCCCALFLCVFFFFLIRKRFWPLHCRLQAFSGCGVQASRCRGFRRWAEAQQLHYMVLADPQHVGPSRTRDQIRAPCIGRRTLNQWTTRESILMALILRSCQFWGWKRGGGKVTFYHLDGNSWSLWGHRGTGRGMWVEREGGSHSPPASGMEPKLNEGTWPRDSYRHPHLLEWLSSVVRVTEALSQHPWNKQLRALQSPRCPLWSLSPSGWLLSSGSVIITEWSPPVSLASVETHRSVIYPRVCGSRAQSPCPLCKHTTTDPPVLILIGKCIASR